MHEADELDPVAPLVDVPAKQKEQLWEPVNDEYMPAEQALHEVAPANE